MVIPKKFLKEGKYYRIKIRDPLKHEIKSGHYTNAAKESHANKLSAKKLDAKFTKKLQESTSGFDALLYHMSRALTIVKIYRIRNEGAGTRITFEINIRYGQGNTAGQLQTSAYFYYKDLVYLEEVVSSEHYFVQNPLKTTETTIKVCHIELNRARALELIEQLFDFISTEVDCEEEEEK